MEASEVGLVGHVIQAEPGLIKSKSVVPDPVLRPSIQLETIAVPDDIRTRQTGFVVLFSVVAKCSRNAFRSRISRYLEGSTHYARPRMHDRRSLKPKTPSLGLAY